MRRSDGWSAQSAPPGACWPSKSVPSIDTPQGLKPHGFWRLAGNSSGASQPTRTGTTLRHGPARPRATCPTCPYCQAAGGSGEHPRKRPPTTPFSPMREEAALEHEGGAHATGASPQRLKSGDLRGAKAFFCQPVDANNGHGEIHPAGDRAADQGACGDQDSTVKGANCVEPHRLPSFSTTSPTPKRRPAVELPRPSKCPASPLADMEYRRAVGYGGGAHGNFRVCAMERSSASKTFAHHVGQRPWRVVTACRSVYAVRRDPRRYAWLAPIVPQFADSSTAEHYGPTSERAAGGSGATERAAHRGSRWQAPAEGRWNRARVRGHRPFAQWHHTDTHVQRAYAAIRLRRGRAVVMSAGNRRTRCNFRSWPPWATGVIA